MSTEKLSFVDQALIESEIWLCFATPRMRLQNHLKD